MPRVIYSSLPPPKEIKRKEGTREEGWREGKAQLTTGNVHCFSFDPYISDIVRRLLRWSLWQLNLTIGTQQFPEVSESSQTCQETT
jgi:hypothetical protein